MCMCRCVAVFILSQCWSSRFTNWFACDNVLPLGRFVQTAAFFRPQCDEQQNMPNKIIVLPIACSNFVSVAETGIRTFINKRNALNVCHFHPKLTRLDFHGLVTLEPVWCQFSSYERMHPNTVCGAIE
jgi:hypothetical protein